MPSFFRDFIRMDDPASAMGMRSQAKRNFFAILEKRFIFLEQVVLKAWNVTLGSNQIG